MGSLKDILNQENRGTFPNATFVIEGEPPEAQCSEALLEGDNAVTTQPPFLDLVDAGAFAGHNLVGKVCHIIASVGGNTGNFNIIINDDDSVVFDSNPGNGTNVEYYITNGGSLILTRTMESFAAFIAEAGYSYTIKGGKLFTNIPSAMLQPACSIVFNPLT